MAFRDTGKIRSSLPAALFVSSWVRGCSCLSSGEIRCSGYPSKSTLHKESLLLRQLFEFGQRRGYTTEIPEINAPKPQHTRAAF